MTLHELVEELTIMGKPNYTTDEDPDDTCPCPRHRVFDVRGFKDYLQALKVTSQMAALMRHPYWLVQDHHAIYHFVQIPPDEVNIRAVKTAFNYVGVVVLSRFDSMGVERL
jgi:hypothetical protein